MAEVIPILELPMLTVGNPVQVDGRYFGARDPSPRIGEHTTEVLSELAFMHKEIEELPRRQAVFQNR